MTDKNAELVRGYYLELAKLGPTQDWQNILKSAKKILGIAVNDTKAFQCKIVSLIHLDKFDEALTSIERFPTENPSEFAFEKAYCEYRLNRIDDAYKTLKAKETPNLKDKELLAQVTYRLEKYEESYELYREIIKSTQDDYEYERQTNFSAVAFALNNSGAAKKTINMNEYENKTYELCYNSACLAISEGKYKDAETKLNRAVQMCKATFEGDEDMSESELENELAIIRVQLAYCLQKLGKTEDALKVYNQVLKNKPSDITVVAVASNNIVTINKDQNIFDSKKRIKAAAAPELDLKLNSKQREVISYNEILLGLIANQNDLASKLIKQFETKFTDSAKLIGLKVSQWYKDKRYKEAESYLKDIYEKNKQSCPSIVKYFLAQVYFVQGKLNELIDVLKSIDSYLNYPGLVSVLVYTYNKLNKIKEASGLLNEAIELMKTSNKDSKQLEIYLKENIDSNLKQENYKKAAELLEYLRTIKPNDYRIVSQLINTYLKFDPEKAKKLSGNLPPLEKIVENSEINFDELEVKFSEMNLRFSKAKLLASKDDKAASADAAKDLTKKKKKKKRKVILPKNMDPSKPIDAERWIPLRERSYYKGKRKKKQNMIGKGTQGAVSSDVTQSPKASPAVASPQQEKNIAAAAAAAAASKSKSNVQKKKKKGPKW